MLLARARHNREIIKNKPLGSGICLFLLLAALLPGKAQAQTFEPIPALNFSVAAGAGNPLTQAITVTSTGASFNFFGTPSTNTGGSWLQINPSNFGCCGLATPQAIQVSAIPGSLAAGTYTGQVVFTAGSNTLTVPVTMVIHPTTAAFFDQVAGGLTFTLATHGNNPPGQSIEVRNGGTGTLNWSATTSTADGGGWLSVSPASGAAPMKSTIAIQVSSLPGAGLTAGTFTGQVLLSGGGDKETIPITVIVNDSGFAQINPLNFTKTFAQWDPLPQVLTVATPGTNFNIYGSVANSTGGNWLSISPSNFGCCGFTTPQAITVSVNPAVTLAAGTYMSEVIFKSSDGKQILTIPVTLKVSLSTTAHFDDVAGAASFSMQTGSSTAPPAMEMQIRNAGSGTLNWTAVASTADGHAWLTVSAPSGTAPATLSVSVVPANLPGGGLTAGMFVGQVVLSGSGGPVTIPVTMNAGASVFRQANPIDFTKVFAGPNPLPQQITVASTGTNFNVFANAVSTSGNVDWLQISPSNFGCCGLTTPQVITVSANPAVTQAAGTYTAEIIFTSSDGKQSMTIPVTLAIESGSTPFFDSLPGQLTFSMLTGGATPPGQVLEIRNAGGATLNWTATTSTSDGGTWLKVLPASGSAPGFPTVSVVPGNVPGGGLVAGTFTGQVLVKGSGDEVTIPVTFTVGASVFRQVNALDFTKIFSGADPLPQRIEVTSTGAAFNFFGSAVSFSGTPNWLRISPSNFGCCGIATPQVITVSIVTDPTLAVGTYTGQVFLIASGGAQSMTVPVTLTVAAENAPTIFDSLPGQVSFSMVTAGKAPPAQPIEIRNAGTGTLNWTASTITSDSGAWLKVTPSGTAPGIASVSVVPTKLPGGGLVAGTFTGEVTLTASGQRATIPVTMVVGNPVFRQINPLDFTKVFGGPSPLPQVIEVASTSTEFNFFASVANSTGGNWLSISPSNYGCCGVSTRRIITVSVNPDVTLAAGSYTGEILIVSSDGKQSLNVPVTLAIRPATVPFFDDMLSAVDFFQATGGAAPGAKSVLIRNAGAGTLNWTASITTADGGKWLKISAPSGTAPSTLSVTVTPANLPGGGLIGGTFVGQIVLVTNGDRETIPVNYRVGAPVFQPLPSLTFSKPFGGADPVPQTITVLSTGANFNILGATATSTGGSWLKINPSNYGCCGIATPLSVTVSVTPDTTLAAGQYVGEVIFQTSTGDGDLIVPVTLTINTSSATATPVFTPPAGAYDSAQTVTITDATKGSAIYYTTDGSTPTTSSPQYSTPIPVTATETIKAIATSPGRPQSAVATAVYTITTPKAAEPAAMYTIAITEATQGATVYYTTDGSIPTQSSTQYTGPITLATSSILKFIAIGPGFSPSDVRTVTTTIQ